MILRMTALRRYWPYLTLILVPLVVLWPAVLLGRGLGPFDQIRQMSPWGDPVPAKPWDVLQADGVLQFYLWRDLVFEAWRNFQVPFWNPYELAGTPLLANSQSGALYPPHIAMGVLHVPTAFAISLLAWFHLAWAGLGTYYFARRAGANRVGGVVAGTSFALSAFMIAWSGLPSVPTTVAWIPWILGLTMSLFRDSHERYWVRVLQLAVCFGMLILAGHLQFVAYGALSAVILVAWLSVVALWEKIDERPHRLIKGVGGFMLAGLLGVGIAAPQLLPVLSFSQFSHRQNKPSEEGYLAYQASAIQPYELIGIVHPNLMGQPAEGLANVKGAERSPAYWPAYVKRGANFAEGAIGLGPLIIGLLLLSRRRYDWRATGGIALLGLISVLLATGTYLGRLLYFFIPGWSATGSPGRISVLFVLAMCVLAGVFASQGSEPQGTQKWRPYLPVAGMAIVSIASIYLLMFALPDLKSWIPQVTPELLQEFIAQSTAKTKALAALSTLVAGVAVGYWLKGARKPNWVLPVAAVASMMLSVPAVLRFSESSDLHVDGPPHDRIAAINDSWDLLTAAPANLPPNTAGISRIHELGGYDSLMHRDTVQMLARVDGGDPAPPANGNMMFVKPGYDAEALQNTGVTEVWTRSPQGVVKTRLEGKGRAFTGFGPSTILHEDASQIVVRALGPGTFSLRDRNMPGWTATVDGKPEPMDEGTIWRELPIGHGEHQIVFNYVAPGYAAGLPMALLAWLVVVIGLALAGRRRSKRDATEIVVDQ
jgi:hypothetical protein